MIPFEQYKKKLHGCFIGKTVGGTLGMRYEGDINVHEISYYDPVPTEMVANDDLDLQVVNLEILLHKGLPITRYFLGDNWRLHVADSNPDEYGVAASNHRLGLNAPVSGIYRNKFTTGMGGAIRSEFWACLVPANPALAATFAKEDACTDHSDDGLYAEMFLAAVESQAFVETDIDKLVETGLRYVAPESRLYGAFSLVLKTYRETGDVLKTREAVLKEYFSNNWTDVIINLSFILLSLISSDGSFDKAICTATSLGYDADCTAATVGAIMGIINPDGIDEKWTAPIGDSLVISANVVNMHANKTLSEFCDSVMSAAYFVQNYYGAVTVDGLSNFKNLKMPKPWTENYAPLYQWNVGDKQSVLTHMPITVVLEYPERIALIPNERTEYKLKLINTNAFAVSGELNLHAPFGFAIENDCITFAIEAGEAAEYPFFVTAEKNKRRQMKNMLTVTATVNGMTFFVEGNLPLSREWQVIDGAGNVSYYENTSSYFPVPKGKFTYKIQINSTAIRRSRISCGGTRPFVVKVNGATVYRGDGSYYVPQFHRDGTWTETAFNWGLNDIEVEFPEHDEGEFFFGVSTTFSCAEWIDYMEYYSLNEGEK